MSGSGVDHDDRYEHGRWDDPDGVLDRERADEGDGLRRPRRLPRLGEATRPAPPDVEPAPAARPPRRDLATDPLMQRLRADAWGRFTGRGS